MVQKELSYLYPALAEPVPSFSALYDFYIKENLTKKQK
jgi:hypothetical protein